SARPAAYRSLSIGSCSRAGLRRVAGRESAAWVSGGHRLAAKRPTRGHYNAKIGVGLLLKGELFPFGLRALGQVQAKTAIQSGAEDNTWWMRLALGQELGQQVSVWPRRRTAAERRDRLMNFELGNGQH